MLERRACDFFLLFSVMVQREPDLRWQIGSGFIA